jgi:hypothetical protein
VATTHEKSDKLESDNNRPAKFYELTRADRKAARTEADYWRKLADVMTRVLASSEGGH